MDAYAVTVVSCDIVHHSLASEWDQLARVRAINDIVADTIAACGEDEIIWASDGDGGHVAFRQESWQRQAIELILHLNQWARTANVPLRISAHRGLVSDLCGADGRVQLVGRGINVASRILDQGSAEGVVVSETFSREIVAGDRNIRFHDPRLMPAAGSDTVLLYLMSADGVVSSWSRLGEGDHAALALALEKGSSWDVLYFAKRIWQVNSADEDVDRALERVETRDLTYRDTNTGKHEANPFVGHPQPDELKQMLRLGKLVERRRGEFICRYDDPGDSLFVILRGEVGVFNSEGEVAADPTAKHSQGEVVGELASAMARNRTADLVALTDVALLSFAHEDVQALLSKKHVGAIAARHVSVFVNYRILEHVSKNTTYLLGPDKDGPLALGPKRPEDVLTAMRQHIELIHVGRRLDLGLENVSAKPNGIYILISGALRVDGDERVVLEATGFPVLWVEVPLLLSLDRLRYRVVREPVKILRIAARGIDDLTVVQREALREQLKGAVDRRHEFDVYICYSTRDSEIVDEICRRFDEAGVTYWYDKERVKPGRQVTQSIESGLMNSRFFLMCLSEHFPASPWAQRETEAATHLNVKSPDRLQVVPLLLNEQVEPDAVIPPLLANANRVVYREFDRLVQHILAARS